MAEQGRMDAPSGHLYSIDERTVNKDVVDEMFRDSHVRNCWELRSYAELAGGWMWEYPGVKDENGNVTPESEALGKKFIKHVEWQFEHVNKILGYKRGLYDLLLLLNNPPKYGHTTFEPVWDYNKDYKQIVLTKFKPLPPDFDVFEWDDFGNLELYYQNFGHKNPIDMKDVKILVNKKDDEFWSNWYGESELRSAWRYWYMKDQMLKSWMDYLEIKVVGQLVVHEPPDLNTTDKAEIRAWQRNITTRTCVSVPGPTYDAEGRKISDGVTVDQVQTQDKGAQYEMAIRYYDSQIAKACFQPEGIMNMSSSTGAGSRAVAEEHGGTYAIPIRAYQMMKEPIIEELGNEMLMLNFQDKLESDEDGNPILLKFKMLMPSREDMLELSQMIKNLIDAGVTIPDEYVRERFNIPEPKAEDEEEPTPPKPQPPTPPTEEPDIDTEEEIPDNVGEAKLAEAKKASELAMQTKTQEPYGHIKKVITKGETNLVSKINDWIERVMNRLIKLADKTIKKADKGNELEEGTEHAEAAEAPGPSYDYSLITKNLVINPEEMTELEGIFNNVGEDTVRFGSNDVSDIMNVPKVKPEQAINWLRSQSTLNGKKIVGDIEQTLQQTIISGLTNGKTIPEMRSILEGEYADILTKPTIETAVRTTVNKAYNQGRAESMKKGGAKGYIFDPTLDDRTTDICSSLPRGIVRVGSPDWDGMLPPFHFNCRTIASPVTEFDDPLEDVPDMSEWDYPPSEGFGGEV